jgi:hypothetical protein
MGLTTHAIAFGLGYALATPEGRARLVGLRDQGAELVKRPEVKQVRERAWDVVGDAGLAARNRINARRTGTTGSGSSGATSTGGTGTGDSPATAAPAPVAVVPTPGAGAADTSVDDTVLGEVGPERLAGTTVAEDTRAVVLGLPEPDPELETPRPKKK